jgi:multiple sugar transport system substrate-binding protein
MGIVAVLMAAAMMAGCGSQGAGPSQGESPTTAKGQDKAVAAPAFSTESITLRMFQRQAGLTDKEFADLIADPVHKKYPNVTIEIVRNGKGQTAPDLVAAGNFPDFIFGDSRYINDYIDLGLATDLQELAKRNNVDLAKFDPVIMETLKHYSAKRETFALPFSMNFAANFYNKDIFDKFGVPYPKDGMTFDELIELGKKVARTEDGVQYRAIDPNSITNFGTALAVPFIDKKTGKADMTTDGWKKLIQTYMNINLNIPNNRYDIGKKATGAFIKDKTEAMFLAFGGLLGSINQAVTDGDPLNWDVVSYPQYKDMPGKGWEVNAHVMLISTVTKHPNEIMQILSLITDKEHQLAMTKQGRLSALNDPEMKKNFAGDLASTKGKNIQGIFKVTHTPGADRTTDDDLVRPFLTKAIDQILKGKSDINTALAEATDNANKALEEKKNQ